MNFDKFELIAYLAEKKVGPTEYDLTDEDSLVEFLFDHYNIDIESFEVLIDDLLPLCTVAQSPLTDIWYRGFGTNDTWLLNKRIE